MLGACRQVAEIEMETMPQYATVSVSVERMLDRGVYDVQTLSLEIGLFGGANTADPAAPMDFRPKENPATAKLVWRGSRPLFQTGSSEGGAAEKLSCGPPKGKPRRA